MKSTINDDDYFKYFNSIYNISMNDGTNPLLKEQVPTETPYDPVNGIVYDGMNGVMMSIHLSMTGSDDNRYLRSYDIEADPSLSTKHGAQPIPIAYYNRYNETKSDSLQSEGESKYYYVYHAKDVNGLPPIEKVREFQELNTKDKRLHTTRNVQSMKLTSALDAVNNMLSKTDSVAMETARSISKFRLCQETRTRYTPGNPGLLKDETGMQMDHKLKSIYFGNQQANRLVSKDMEPVSTLSRSHTINNSLKMENMQQGMAL